MDGLLLGFVVFFVLALACICSIGVVRMLTKSRFNDNPPWPHLQPRARHGRRFHRARHSG
jgi:hypothetical protein